MLAGSPPSAIATGIVSPRSAITRQCAAPTLWRCQCIASVFFPSTWTRYIPTFRTPDSGLLVMTPPRVIYGPPSSGQQIGTGHCVRSTSDCLITVSWHAGRLTVFGGNFATSASRGSMASLPSRPSGTLSAVSSAMRSPTRSRHSTPSASDMRRSEPKRLTATGYRDFPPPASIGAVNSSAGPPPGDFMQRSATSVISLSTETGCSMRRKSPAASIAPRNSRRLASGMMHRADAAGQPLECDARESRGGDAMRQGFRFGEREHRLWQVRIRVPMFRHQPADGGQNTLEVQEVHGPERREARRGEFEYDESRAGLQHTGRFAQASVEIGEVADAEPDERAVEVCGAKRQRERVGGDGRGARRFAAAPRQHRNGEVGADDAAAKAVLTGELGGEVERAGTEIEVGAVGFCFPRKPRHRGPTPGPVHVETQQMIEEVVARRDRRKDVTHVRRGAGGSHKRER